MLELYGLIVLDTHPSFIDSLLTYILISSLLAEFLPYSYFPNSTLVIVQFYNWKTVNTILNMRKKQIEYNKTSSSKELSKSYLPISSGIKTVYI